MDVRPSGHARAQKHVSEYMSEKSFGHTPAAEMAHYLGCGPRQFFRGISGRWVSDGEEGIFSSPHDDTALGNGGVCGADLFYRKLTGSRKY